MRVLTISRNKLEVTRAQLRRPALTIGRSPSCDILLRVPGIAPVQFLVEWIGNGKFDPSHGAWSIVDISNADPESNSGEGIVLSSEAVLLGDLLFECIEDNLESDEEIGGRIKESLTYTGGDADLLEIVQIRADSGAVEDIRHVRVPAKSTKKPLLLSGTTPELKVHWMKNAGETAVRIILEELHGAEIFVRGQRIHSDRFAELHPKDILRVRWNGRDFCVRFVAEVKSPKVAHSILGDRLLRRLVISILLTGSLFLLFLHYNPPEPVHKNLPPQRIARVEIPVPPPPPPPSTALVSEVKHIEAKKSPEKAAAKAPPKSVAPIVPPKPQTKPIPTQAKSKPAPTPPPKIADVKSVGLLGMLGKAGSKGKGVKAENLLVDRPAQTNSREPKILLTTPPVGSLGTGNQGGVNDTAKTPGLSAASSAVQGLGNYKASTVGLTPRKGDSSGLSISAGGDAGNVNDNNFSTGTLGSGEFSVEGGGLDRETVRRVIASYRGEIRTCYERSLLTQTDLEGGIVFDWNIAAAGSVARVDILKTTLNSQSLSSCVKDVIRRMIFPKGQMGRSTRVIYPFVFQGTRSGRH